MIVLKFSKEAIDIILKALDIARETTEATDLGSACKYGDVRVDLING